MLMSIDMEKIKGYTSYLALTGKAREETSEIQCTVIAVYEQACLKDENTMTRIKARNCS